ncbi:hypothetical protein LEMLEM_LOCUS26534 [Lemmus lemmus]
MRELQVEAALHEDSCSELRGSFGHASVCKTDSEEWSSLGANRLKIPLPWAQGFVPWPSETASLYLPFAAERILGFLDQCMTPGCSFKDF